MSIMNSPPKQIKIDEKELYTLPEQGKLYLS